MDTHTISNVEKEASLKFEAMNDIILIRRDELPSITGVSIEGLIYSLGEHRDFRKNEVISQFIPTNSRLAIAWVKLKSGEILHPHVHPIESMIILCEGEGEFIGDNRRPLSAGDIVLVPRGVKHGFKGQGRSGFSALSLQFEQSGLYETPQSALVEFCKSN